MNIAEHPRPCLPTPPTAKTILVDLANHGMPGRGELLIVEPVPNGEFVVACLPFFTHGVQFGDLVAVRESDGNFSHVIASSGLRSFRIAFKAEAQAHRFHSELHKRIVDSGLPHEWFKDAYLVVLLRGEVDQEVISSCLVGLEDAIEWEVDPVPFAAR